MSLALEVDNVMEVLLADGWHLVRHKSFGLDSYEYLWGGQVLHGGGSSDVCAIGFMFTDGTDTFAGPLTSILAIKYLQNKPKPRENLPPK